MRALSPGELMILTDHADRLRSVGASEETIAAAVAELRRRFEEAIEWEEEEDERDRLEGRQGPPDWLFTR